jgi:hypothetical protein
MKDKEEKFGLNTMNITNTLMGNLRGNINIPMRDCFHREGKNLLDYIATGSSI